MKKVLALSGAMLAGSIALGTAMRQENNDSHMPIYKEKAIPVSAEYKQGVDSTQYRYPVRFEVACLNDEFELASRFGFPEKSYTIVLTDKLKENYGAGNDGKPEFVSVFGYNPKPGKWTDLPDSSSADLWQVYGPIYEGSEAELSKQLFSAITNQARKLEITK